MKRRLCVLNENLGLQKIKTILIDKYLNGFRTFKINARNPSFPIFVPKFPNEFME